MKRWWVVVALLLSLGVNLGILAMVGLERWQRNRPGESPAAVEVAPPRPAAASTEPSGASQPEPVPVPQAQQPKPPPAVSAAPPATTGRGERGVEEPDEPPGGSFPAPAAAPVMAARMADRLGLVGARRERFVALQQTFLETTFATRRAADLARRELRQELLSPAPERAVANDLVAKVGRLQGELERLFVGNVLDSRELLEPVEERQFLQMLARLRPLALGQAPREAPPQNPRDRRRGEWGGAPRQRPGERGRLGPEPPRGERAPPSPGQDGPELDREPVGPAARGQGRPAGGQSLSDPRRPPGARWPGAGPRAGRQRPLGRPSQEMGDPTGAEDRGTGAVEPVASTEASAGSPEEPPADPPTPV